jgi:hypothetical protein
MAVMRADLSDLTSSQRKKARSLGAVQAAEHCAVRMERELPQALDIEVVQPAPATQTTGVRRE